MANGKVVIDIDGDNSQFIKEMEEISNSAEQVAKDSAQSFNDFGNKAALSVAAVATAMIALEKGTREQREEVNKLTTAFEDSGKTATQATNTYRDLYGIMGESDSAVESAQQLAVLTNNQEELAEWTDIAAGVYAKFDDALKLETLAEGANVTATLGKATGGMVDALEFAGITVDEFDANLAQMVTQEERAEYVTKVLSDTYSDLGAVYQENNKEVIEAREAELELSLAMAELGAAVSPIVADLTNLAADVLPLLTTAFEENKEVILAAAAAILAGAVAAKGFAVVQTVAIAVKSWTTATTAQTGAQLLLNKAMTANPIGLLITGIAALTAGIIALVNFMGSQNEAFQELKQHTEDTTNAINDFQNVTASSISQTEKNAATSQKLVDRLKELEEQGLKTAESQSEYAAIVAELQETMPELNLQIDEQTGLLKQNTEALENELEYLKEQAKANIYLEERTAAMQTLAEAEIELEQNSQRYNELLAERTAAEQEMTAILDEQTAITEKSSALTDADLVRLEELSLRYSTLSQVLSSTSNEFMEQQDVFNGYTETVGIAQAAVDSANESYEEYNSKIAEQAAANAAASATFEQIAAGFAGLETEIAELNAAYDAHYQVVSSNLSRVTSSFNAMEEAVASDLSKLSANLQTQQDYLQNYASNSESVLDSYGSFMSADFKAYITSGTEEAVNLVAGMTDSNETEVKAFIEQWEETKNIEATVSSSMSKVATEYDSKMSDIQARYVEFSDALNMANEASSNTNATVQAIVNTAYANQSRVASAYTALAAAANNAYRRTLDINSPSRVFEENTGYTTEAIEKQIKKDTPNVEKAYSDLASATVTGFNAGQTALNVFGTNAVNNATARSLGSNSQSISKTINSTNSEIVVKSDIYLNDEKIGEAVSPTVNKELASYEDYEERGSL